MAFASVSYSTPWDVMCVCPCSPTLTSRSNPALTVNRLIAASVRGCLFVMEFAWLVSGAFSVRFHPFASLGTNPKANFRVDAFSKPDADILAAIALCGEPSQDFLNANFAKLLLVYPRYTLKSYDTAFQLSCVFCTSRGILQCACPMPMKRRSADSNPVSAHRASSVVALWDALSFAKKSTASRGAAIYNVHMATNVQLDKVLAGGFVPFNFDFFWYDQTPTTCIMRQLS